MKVLMFGWEFPPFISGGLGTACYGITRGLVNNGVEVSFVLPTKRKQHLDTHVRLIAADEVMLSRGFESLMRGREPATRFSGKRLLALSPYYTREFYRRHARSLEAAEAGQEEGIILDFTGHYGENLFSEVSAYALVAEFLARTGDYDVIHAHDWLTFPAGVAAKRAARKPLVVHMHATEFDRSGENMNRDVYETEQYGMRNADRIIAVSHYTKNILVRRYGIPDDKVEVVHNAVDRQRQIERFGIQKPLREKIVLFLGRVTMQKGPEYFLEAAIRVLKRIPNVRFVMAGTGDMLFRIISMMANARIARRFHFTGFLRGLDVEKMYAMSDLYVMPSVSEPFGIAAFEALLYDVPIIISKQSGVAEILKNAVTVDFWDVNKLAESMIELLEDEKRAHEVVERCKADIQHIGWNHAGARIRSIYASLR